MNNIGLKYRCQQNSPFVYIRTLKIAYEKIFSQLEVGYVTCHLNVNEKTVQDIEVSQPNEK